MQPAHYGLRPKCAPRLPNAEGKVVQNLQDPACSRYGFITAITEHNDRLYLGSFTEAAIDRLALE